VTLVKSRVRIRKQGKPLPNLRVTRRFMGAYRSTVAGYQALVEGEIHDFVRRYRSNPPLALHGFDRLAHIRSGAVYELEVNRSDRLLAIWQDGALVLVDLGSHEITARYSTANFRTDSLQHVAAPDWFWPDSNSAALFADRLDESFTNYETETSPEWIYWLSSDQQQALRAIINDWGDLPRSHVAVHFIVGGPGTGKTSVLINLLKEFVELRHTVGVAVSDRLAQYLKACLRTTAIDDRRGYTAVSESEIVLIDDPPTYDRLYWPVRNLSPRSKTKMLVMAFDPCQLEDSLSDTNFDSLVKKNRITVHQLTQCYRQKKNVGRAAQSAFNAIARSSAFFRSDKIEKFRQDHQALTRFSNQVTFVNPGGYSKSYLPRATITDLRIELDRVSARYPRWTHWPGILAVVDSDAKMPTPWINLVRAAGADVVDRTDIDQIKGVEYQHAFLFFGPDLQKRIKEVVNGQGKNGYFETRLLRIPLSRAKDSVVVFGLAPE